MLFICAKSQNQNFVHSFICYKQNCSVALVTLFCRPNEILYIEAWMCEVYDSFWCGYWCWWWQASIDVSREEVEEYHEGGGYWCECHAWNDVAKPSTSTVPRSASSIKTVIHIACEWSALHCIITDCPEDPVSAMIGHFLWPRRDCGTLSRSPCEQFHLT